METLATLKGKFLLSSYPSEILDAHIKKNGWYSKAYTKPRTANKATKGIGRTSKKVEVLTANYPLE